MNEPTTADSRYALALNEAEVVLPITASAVSDPVDVDPRIELAVQDDPTIFLRTALAENVPPFPTTLRASSASAIKEVLVVLDRIASAVRLTGVIVLSTDEAVTEPVDSLRSTASELITTLVEPRRTAFASNVAPDTILRIASLRIVPVLTVLSTASEVVEEDTRLTR